MVQFLVWLQNSVTPHRNRSSSAPPAALGAWLGHRGSQGWALERSSDRPEAFSHHPGLL